MKPVVLIFFLAVLIHSKIISQPCFPNGIIFTTQNQIDSFPINYPNCSQIEGSVSISGFDIANLNGLSIVTSINGSLCIEDNPILINLTGLDNLSSVVAIYIINNPSLTNLTGLNSVSSLCHLKIKNNYALNNLTGLENLTSISGDLYVYSNPNLYYLNGIDSLTVIGNDVEIMYNQNLNNLTGLDNLTSIGRWLWIESNPSLNSLTGLGALSSIGLDFMIRHNNSLDSLIGIEGLTYIGGKLEITFNTVLTDLTGLYNLTTIGSYIHISYNPTIATLTGLENIDAGSISGLYIKMNSSLSTCETQSVCDYLTIPNGDVDIQNNATGCNSKEEVAKACGITGVPKLTAGPKVTLHPNPVEDGLTISGLNGSYIYNINIYNQIGQKIVEIKQVDNSIDVSSLPSGLYLFEINTNGKTYHERIIKL